eukprot:gene7211-8019_t
MAGKSNKRKSSSVRETGRKKQKNEDCSSGKGVGEIEKEFQDVIKNLLNVDMPSDFYELWELCLELCPKSPRDALVDTLGLQLTGPYCIVSGELQGIVKDDDASLIHMHSRFFYDPPEFMTVLSEKNYHTGFHIGYFRDEPSALPLIVASNEVEVSCQLKICGDNLFYAVRSHAEGCMKQTKDKSKLAKMKNILSKIDDKAKRSNYNMKSQSPVIKQRGKHVVTKSFHKAGIVVPIDDNEVGYRPLNISDAALNSLLTRICEGESEELRDKFYDELHDLVTLVQFANDECDYGMGLELGIDLFCFANEKFKGMISSLLPMAYSLLGRDIFGEIVKKHLSFRKREGPIDLTIDADIKILKQ